MELRGRVERVIDGDTIVGRLEILPGNILEGVHIRIAGINAPENSTPEGQAATTYARSVLPNDTSFLLKTTSRDKYGRLLGSLVIDQGSQDFGTLMIKTGHAVVYKGLEGFEGA